MGVNDAGLAIGNEAVFTRVPVAERGLTGMDLVRLALERAGDARSGVALIAELLETHGQGGPGGHRDKRFAYHNSFLLADPEQAWVLETAGHAWAAARVRGVRAISNGLTLRDDWDLAADGLASRARDAGRAPGKGKLDFTATFADPLITLAAAARQRRGCTEAALRRHEGRIDVGSVARALRQHGPEDRPERSAGAVFGTVCAHASWLPTRRAGQTTGALIAHLSGSQPTSFVTATAATCTSTFKPVWLDSGLPDSLGPAPGDRASAASLWWRHERLHRRALADLGAFLRDFASERDALEMSTIARAIERRRDDVGARRELTRDAFDASERFSEAWLRRLGESPGLPGPLYSRYWAALDRASGLFESASGRLENSSPGI